MLPHGFRIYDPGNCVAIIAIIARENRERRIGIDRVKDAVEKCLMQVIALLSFFHVPSNVSF